MIAEKKNKKQTILDAAAVLFREKGYSATSIRDLAYRVGLEPSSIYSHIQSKEELLVTICLDCARQFTEGMQQIMESDYSPKKKLKKLIELHLHIAYNDATSIAVFSDEWKHLPESALPVFIGQRKEYANNFKEILKEGKRKGIFDFENVDIIFNTIINAMRWTYYTSNKHSESDVNAEITGFIIKGLKKD
ncbi:MAG: TetR/AcrR family transcriptional regulator [Saprospiraceae bacterium]|nr:TetR/AcrR family transcriptional regulator [Saprospiraceae bacterium]